MPVHSLTQQVHVNDLLGIRAEDELPRVAQVRNMMGEHQQQRHGYFRVDPDSTSGKLVFNRTVALKDTWAKVENKKTLDGIGKTISLLALMRVIKISVHQCYQW